MVKVFSYQKQMINMKVNLNKDNLMAMVNKHGQMVIYIKVIFLIQWNMVKVNYNFVVVIVMKVNLNIINLMVLEFIDGKMVNIMRVNLQMDK